jgi:hypothetical protein
VLIGAQAVLDRLSGTDAGMNGVYAKAASGVMIRIDGIRKDIEDTLSATKLAD